jgi:hypothetical protein
MVGRWRFDTRRFAIRTILSVEERPMKSIFFYQCSSPQVERSRQANAH